MNGNSRLWIGLILLLAVNDGGSSRRRDNQQDGNLTTSNFTHLSQLARYESSAKTYRTIEEKRLSERTFTTEMAVEILFEAEPWMEARNITVHTPTNKVNLNVRNRLVKLQRLKIDSLEHLINNWWLPSLSLNTTRDEIENNLLYAPDAFIHEFNHSQFIMETMLTISHILEKIDLVNKCSRPSIEEIRRTTSEMVNHIFLDMPQAPQMSWINKNHPVGKHIRKFCEASKREKNCGLSLNDEFIKNHFEQLVAGIDDDLKKFLFKRMAPLIGYLSTNRGSTMKKIFPILHYECIHTFGTKGQSMQQCTNDLSNLYAKIVEDQDDPFSDKNNLMRYKRSSATEETKGSILTSESNLPQATIQDIEKSGSYGGGGGYGGGDSYGGYDDPNIIFIPGEGNDFSYPLILKFLGILVIGTYVFLGLLVAHTLLSLFLFGFGPVGEKGNRGPTGPKGMLGDQGMKGMKGMLGANGGPGTVGPKGMDGAKGDDGPAGAPGPAGPTGPDGDKGEKGETGDKGAKGQPGNPGMGGDPGEKGEQGFKGIKGTRRKRDASILATWGSTPDILDAPDLLSLLYQKKDLKEKQDRERDASSIVSTINDFWREFQSPVGCLRCSLFEFLNGQHIDSLDSYVAAGFAHVLGDSGSLQLLDQVRRAKKKMIAVRCTQWGSSCKLEYIGDK